MLPGTDVTDLAGAIAFFKKHAKAGIALKAIAGGGGRGMRLIRSEGEIADAFARATAEAKSAFGNGDLYAERLVGRARHIEVQIVGDGRGGIVALGERECTLQRRSQKIVELAPSPNLKPALRKKIVEAAVTMAKSVKYRSLGTFEFLVDEADFFFIEANPRLQVEHTVTEEVWGVDLVKAQLLLAGGASLAKTGLEGAAAARPCDPAPGQHGDHDRRRLGQAGRRHAHRVRAAVGPGRAGRHLRLCRLPHQSQFRLAACQGDRAQPVGRFRRRAVAGRARAGRLPTGRRAQQHRLPARPAGACRFPRRQGPYPLRRRARQEAHGRGRQARRRTLFPIRDGRGAAGRTAGGRPR